MLRPTQHTSGSPPAHQQTLSNAARTPQLLPPSADPRGHLPERPCQLPAWRSGAERRGAGRYRAGHWRHHYRRGRAGWRDATASATGGAVCRWGQGRRSWPCTEGMAQPLRWWRMARYRAVAGSIQHGPGPAFLPSSCSSMSHLPPLPSPASARSLSMKLSDHTSCFNAFASRLLSRFAVPPHASKAIACLLP